MRRKLNYKLFPQFYDGLHLCINTFMVYLTTLSVAQAIITSDDGSKVNDGWKRFRKETVIGYLKVFLK
jgi:hypothetical protein